MTIRKGRGSDMEAAATLVRGSFNPVAARYMVYTQHGVAAFLRVFVDHPHLSPDRTFLVAEDVSGTLEGFAEFRTAGENGSFLSYLCVAPRARGKGIAQALVKAFLDANPAVSEMQLDVFHDSGPALALYRKLGFESRETSVWLARDLPPAADRPLAMLNLSTAQACFNVYGFCEMTVRHEGRETRVGRIGPRVLRCFSAADFNDLRLLAAARAAYPELEEALLVASETDAAADALDAAVVNRAIRMVLVRPKINDPVRSPR